MSEEFNFWKGMMKKYWYTLVVFGIAVVGAIVGAIVVLFLYIYAPDIAGGGTWTIGEFSLGAAILWVIFLVLWELLAVVLPFIVFCGITFIIFWFLLISEEDKTAIKGRERKEKKKPKKARGGGGAAGILFFIAFVLVVLIDGNLWIPFDNLSYSYYVFAYLVGFMWTCIVLGIPALIVGIVFLLKWMKKVSTQE